MEWSELQKKAIDSRAPRLLVSASAGSGKTTVMIARVLQLLKEGHSLENMLISTFTKAAAADMREKLSRALLSQEEEHLLQQAELLPQSDVTNLHSFCQRQITSYFYAVGVDPGFSVMDEGESGAMLEQALDEVMRQEIVAGDSTFLMLYDILRAGRQDKILRKTVKSIYRYSMLQPDPQAWRSTEPSRTAVYEQILEAWNQKRDSLLSRLDVLCKHTEAAGFSKNIPLIEELMQRLREGGGPLSVPRGKIPPEYTALNDVFKLLKEKGKACLEERAELLTLANDRRAADYVRVLARMTERLQTIYAAEKKAQAKLDFADLEHLMLALLRDEGVGNSICEKYRFVFVDEYQDINPLQETILSRIARTAEIYYVGDIKQSIYAFRGCESDIFLQTYRTLKAEGQQSVIELNNNYRSNEGILAFCNDLFASIMTERFGGIAYETNSMFALAQAVQTSAVQMHLVCGEKKQDKPGLEGVYRVADAKEETADGVSETEQNLVVSRILYLMGQDVAAGGERRPIALSDIVILTRSSGSYISDLTRKLLSAGIAVSISDTLRFHSQYETRVLIEYLDLLSNFENDIALLAVMRSHFGGFDDNELARIRIDQPDAPYFYEAAGRYRKQDALQKKLNRFLETVRHYYTLSLTMRVDALLGRIVSDAEYFKYVFSMPDGAARAETVDAFLTHVSESPHAASLFMYLQYLQREEPLTSRKAKPDAVRIMTIHNSKGLEFPYVFLVNTGKPFNLRDLYDQVLCDRELGICMKVFDAESRTACKSHAWQLAYLKKSRKQAEEEMRLLYVALTRAQEGLYIFGSMEEDSPFYKIAQIDPKLWDHAESTSFLMLLAPVLEKYGRFYTPDDCLAIEDQPLRPIMFPSFDRALAGKIRERMEFRYPHGQYAQKTFVTQLAEEDRLQGYPQPVLFPDASSGGALERGTAYHKAMELLDFEADFEKEWQRIVFSGKELVQKEDVCRAVEAVRTACAGKTVYRERSFLLNGRRETLGLEGTGDILVQGVIDVLAVDGQGAVLIDYKTTRKENLLSESYRTQLGLYVQAVKELLLLPVQHVFIYSFDAGELIELNL